MLRKSDAAADGNEGGELARMLGCKIPGSVTTHGKAGEISAQRIAMKFFHRRLQCFHGKFVHGWLGPPKFLAALREDDHSGEAAAVEANGSADADLRLQQAILAALAGAVKKQNDRPFSCRGPLVWDENLILVFRACHSHGAVQKTRLHFPCACGSGGKCHGSKGEQEGQEHPSAGKAHGHLQERHCSTRRSNESGMAAEEWDWSARRSADKGRDA